MGRKRKKNLRRTRNIGVSGAGCGERKKNKEGKGGVFVKSVHKLDGKGADFVTESPTPLLLRGQVLCYVFGVFTGHWDSPNAVQVLAW